MSKGRAGWLSWPYASEVSAVLLATLAAVAVALQIGPPGSALAAGASAAIVGATALKDSPQGRWRLTAAASLAMGGAVLLGWLASPHSVVFVLVAGLWSLCSGMAWALGSNVGLVSAATTALLVASPTWGSPLDALIAAALAFCAGMLQTVIVVITPRPQRQQRSDALADGYRLVVADARRLAADPGAELDHGPLIALRQKFTLTEHQLRRRPLAFRGLYAIPERIGMTLNALRPVADTPAGGATLRAAANVLETIAEDPPGAREEARAALGSLDSAIDELPGPAGPTGRRLRRQVIEAAALHFTGSHRPRPEIREVVRAQLNLASPILRHGLRLVAAVTAATAAARITGVHDGYWIAVTVLLVLRPETAHTYTRCTTRLAGVLGGMLLGTGITLLIHPTGIIAGILAVAFVAVAYAVAGIGYVPLTAAVATAIVFLVDIDGAAPTLSLGTRIVAVLVGGVLAIASHVLLPDRAQVRLQQRSAELLKAEIDYVATVIRAFAHHLDDRETVLSAVWTRAVRARSAFEAAGGGIRADTPEMRHWLSAYRAALNTLTSTGATLEAQLPTVRTENLDLRFVVAVDDYVDALRGETPTAGQPWRVDARHLAEADAQMRECATYLDRQESAQRVLLGELEAITRVLLAVAQTGS
ncbi:MAG TPA: FUSC family protein [Mycolicibacterium fallax]|nr:FUSC family protein [Mycolicibacterium fallax]